MASEHALEYPIELRHGGAERLDGNGYPAGVSRASLNLGTMLCSIADVYDAMRSQRSYQEAFATDRILAVLKRNDGQQFDQHLVRRFVQLMGIYPPGTLVALDDGRLAIVTAVHAPAPERPRVRVVFGPRDDPWYAIAGTPEQMQAEINDFANLAFISDKANKKIGARPPASTVRSHRAGRARGG